MKAPREYNEGVRVIVYDGKESLVVQMPENRRSDKLFLIERGEDLFLVESAPPGIRVCMWEGGRICVRPDGQETVHLFGMEFEDEDGIRKRKDGVYEGYVRLDDIEEWLRGEMFPAHKIPGRDEAVQKMRAYFEKRKKA